MALKDLFAVIDNGLKDVFDRKAADPTKARRPLLRGIDRALAQYKSGSAGTPTGWYKIRNGVVALTVKVGGDTFDINGVATNHMPVDRFEEFLTNMRAAVEAGEFDAELANHGNGEAEVHIPKQRKTATISQRQPRRAASRPPPAARPTATSWPPPTSPPDQASAHIVRSPASWHRSRTSPGFGGRSCATGRRRP